MINNLEAYKVFYYVAKCGSVTKAAGELSISQPAVSQAIKQLENTLDAALFHRAAKGVRLTSEGEPVSYTHLPEAAGKATRRTVPYAVSSFRKV